MPNIETHLPLSALQPFIDNVTGRDEVTFEWRTRYFADLKQIVEPALVEFFKELKAEGRLNVIPNSQGYSCRLWDAWNNAAKIQLDAAPAELTKTLTKLAEKFASPLVFSITYPYSRALKEQQVDSIPDYDHQSDYEKEIRAFNLSKGYAFHFSHESCVRTDMALILELDDWVATGKCIIGQDVVDVPPAPGESVQETVITLKTGNLLVADWFRLDEFTKSVEPAKRFSLNSLSGRDAKTKFLAEHSAVISVCVDNTCPAVLQADNQVVVGYYDTDTEDGVVTHPEGYRYIGNVCTDLWAATFVEYETLVEIVARTQPLRAKEMVDAYIEEHQGGSYGLHRMTVQPGEYFIYHFGEIEEFADRAKAAGIELPDEAITPYFIFSKTRLMPTATK